MYSSMYYRPRDYLEVIGQLRNTAALSPGKYFDSDLYANSKFFIKFLTADFGKWVGKSISIVIKWTQNKNIFRSRLMKWRLNLKYQ
jgi:hypothetical protein